MTRLAMTPHTVRRQPLSCENCRNRKIKCTGGRSPCDSCNRRGFQASCHFLRSSGTPNKEGPYNELVERIASLEALLRQHITANDACHRVNRLPTPVESSSTTSGSPKTARSLAGDDAFAVSSFPLPGSLLKSPGGYVRFVPHTEAFNTEDMAAFMHAESPASSHSSIGFPFSSETSSSRQTLLELLPSRRQCDELMQRYLDVFSPV